MADYGCDYCDYEEKCGLYEYCCPYQHLFNHSNDKIAINKLKNEKIICDIEKIIESVKNDGNYETLSNILTNELYNLKDLYSEETLNNFKKLTND